MRDTHLQLVAVITTDPSIRETVIASARIWKTGHQVLNLSAHALMDHVVHRKSSDWIRTNCVLLERCDSLIILGIDGLNKLPELEQTAMSQNIPVFFSFEDWYSTLAE